MLEKLVHEGYKAIAMFGEPDEVDLKRLSHTFRSFDDPVYGITGMWGSVNKEVRKITARFESTLKSVILFINLQMMTALTDLEMAIVNAAEWIVIIVIIAALIFGAKKIPELARSFGRVTTEYEKAKIEGKKELHRLKDQGTTTGTAESTVQDNREKLESLANTLGINHSGMTDDELRSAIQAEIKKDKDNV